MDGFQDHNVVAMYLDPSQAKGAIDALRDAGVDQAGISMLSRDDEQAVAQTEQQEEATEVPADAAKGVATGAAAGATGGALVGFIAGAVAFGIPGIGPAVGAGIWAATLGGAAAGATAGGVYMGAHKLWEERYREHVAEGRVLVGVHSDDADQARRAAAVLRGTNPERLDEFDAQGRPTAD